MTDLFEPQRRIAESVAAMPDDPMLVEGETCGRIARAQRAAVLIDGAAYFKVLEYALLRAERSILIVGWDFNHTVPLHCGDTSGRREPSLRQFLHRLTRKRRRLQVRVLKWWSPVAFELKRRTIPFPLLNWLAGRRIHYRLDNDHPPTGSLHQKLVVVDDALAFCGGLDVTDCRWDTPEHLDADPRRCAPRGGVYPPFHDLMMAVDGEAARALGDVARERWERATGEVVEPCPPAQNDLWPQTLRVDFENVDVAVARTEPQWSGRRQIREIEALHEVAIRAARRHVYIENQHFASRAVYQAIRDTLEKPDGPEIVVLGPEKCPGTVEEAVMGPARAKIVNRLRAADRHGRFRAYIPQTAGGNPIVVHSKCLIIDDTLLRIGSANMNNRSMGFDNECDVAIEAPRRPGPGRDAVRRRISLIRTELMAEHLGILHRRVQAVLDETGSLIQSIERLRRQMGRTLRPLEVPPDDRPEEEPADSLLDPEHPERLKIV